MSNDSISYLQELPVEILFKIFDNLDALSLLVSVGSTCRRLRTVVNTYDRLSVDFRNLSKSQFQALLRLINPHNVISLSLRHQHEMLNAINTFCSHYRRRTFDRLQSLVLNDIRDDQLPSLLKCVQPINLTHFILNMDTSGYVRGNVNAEAISTAITSSSLRRLDIQIQSTCIQKIRWSPTNIIKQLNINAYIYVNDLRIVLNHLPHLQIFSAETIRKDLDMNAQMVEKSSDDKFRQLTSLTINRGGGSSIEDIEYLLSLTSSLTHLKLVGYGNYQDGKRWEEFIQFNLPHLDSFEFFFKINKSTSNAMIFSDVDSLMASFQTPFWSDHKKWIVRKEMTNEGWMSSQLHLHSLPICVDKYLCQIESSSNSITCASIEDPSWMDNITTLEWDVKTAVKATDNQKLFLSNQVIFRHVKTLELNLQVERPADWVEQLISFVDLTTISSVKVFGFNPNESMKSNLDDIARCLHLMTNLQSLEIFFYAFYTQPFSAANYFPLIPYSVKHLAISVVGFDDCITILQQFDKLSSFQCYVATNKIESQVEELEDWLIANRTGSCIEHENRLYRIWLEKKTIVSISKRRKYRR